MASKDGVVFSPRKQLLAESCASHNLFVFKGADGDLYAVGGQHNPLSEHQYNDGVYLFDLPVRKTVRNPRRIITVDHAGYVNGIALWGLASEFDGHMCCVYSEASQQYALYLRANPARSRRRIQFAYSENGIAPGLPASFGPFKQIRIDESGWQTGEYYFPAVSVVRDKFICLSPFYNQNYCCIRLLISDDGLDWTVKDDLFPTTPWFSATGDPKNVDQPCNGVIVHDDHILIYVHHNYYGCGAGTPPQVARYRIDIDDLIAP